MYVANTRAQTCSVMIEHREGITKTKYAGDLKCQLSCWRNGSAITPTDCASQGPDFISQQSPGDSQPSLVSQPLDMYKMHEPIYKLSYTYTDNKIKFLSQQSEIL